MHYWEKRLHAATKGIFQINLLVIFHFNRTETYIPSTRVEAMSLTEKENTALRYD
jgi:hypothetical protein